MSIQHRDGAMKGDLHHNTPGWVPAGSRFHVRICADSSVATLTHPDIGPHILEAARHYHRRQQWFLHLLVLMPDHLHAICSFPAEPGMSTTVGLWKRYLSRMHGVAWQRNYFDHRFRNEAEFVQKMAYVRMNPVRAELCAKPDDWPWVLDAQSFQE